MIQIDVPKKGDVSKVLPVVKQANTGESAAFITGTRTVDNDFDTLSQSDLKHGELAFGLPAALIVLMLVFGAVVAALRPRSLMALVSILVGLGSWRCSRSSSALDLHREHAHRDGPRARDRLLAVRDVPLPRGAPARPRQAATRSRVAGATASRAVLFSGSTFVVALFGMLLVPTLDHAQPRGRRDRRRRRLRPRGADAAAGAARAARRPRQLAARAGPRPDLGAAEPSRAASGGGSSTACCAGRGSASWSASPCCSPPPSPIFGLHIGASGVARCRHLPSSRATSRSSSSSRTRNPYPVAIVVRERAPAGSRGPRDARDALRADRASAPATLARAPRSERGVLACRSAATPSARPRVAAVRDLRCASVPAAVRRLRAPGLRRRPDRGDGRLLRRGHAADAVRARVRARAQLPRADDRVPLDRRRARLDRAQPALRRRRLRPADARLRRRRRRRPARLPARPPIDAWVPLFLFSVLFGLSMDYQVFLMSRIKERYDAGGSTARRRRRGHRLDRADHHRGRADHRRRLRRASPPASS